MRKRLVENNVIIKKVAQLSTCQGATLSRSHIVKASKRRKKRFRMPSRLPAIVVI